MHRFMVCLRLLNVVWIQIQIHTTFLDSKMLILVMTVLGKPKKDLIYLSEQSLKSLCDKKKKTFSYNGILEYYVALYWRKVSQQKTLIFQKAVMQQLNSNDAYHFTTTPALASGMQAVLCKYRKYVYRLYNSSIENPDDESPGVADAENKDEHEEDLQSSDDEDDNLVVSEDTIVLDNATINRGLTAKETNALIAAAMMICSSEKIEG
ncbi:uncharacterized protein EV154DRAFT_486667 [Mucor mucedo]|uniref:uncharacterized protein n=1 Tax=Mucor mucedo TaxID=29922 RepID=UPI00221F3C25|nr:uncharacterized protein EV154DRAFT_486667 [Mucor mucedo]KAI7875747.1 hypothetical protein EV154DRAFT_486667 [Mucor mucedo]